VCVRQGFWRRSTSSPFGVSTRAPKPGPKPQALQQERDGLLAEAAARDAALAELEEALAAAEGELGRSPAKQRAMELQVGMRLLLLCWDFWVGSLGRHAGLVVGTRPSAQRPPPQMAPACLAPAAAPQEAIRQLQQQRAELAAEEERAQASPEAQREALMAKVKRDNAELEQLTAAAKAAQDEVRALEAQQAAAAGGAPAAAPADDGPDAQARR
jgi:hypothetical protein